MSTNSHVHPIFAGILGAHASIPAKAVEHQPNCQGFDAARSRVDVAGQDAEDFPS